MEKTHLTRNYEYQFRKGAPIAENDDIEILAVFPAGLKKPEPKVTKVFVNPNHKNVKPSIHINPQMCGKPAIHINPKMMHIQPQRIAEEQKRPEPIAERKGSVYVNPNLMKTLSSSINQSKKASSEVACAVNSKLKLVKSEVAAKNSSPSSKLVALSKRKLVRMKRSPKVPGGSLVKAVKTPIKGRMKLDNRLGNSSSFVRASKATNSRYKVDKTAKKKINRRKSMNLVSIGGVLYKSSGNQLVKSICSSNMAKRRRNSSVNKTEQFFVTKNGKKLCRLDLAKKESRRVSDVFRPVKTSHKKYVSDKVKQKSLQILRNKLRKNNQPCLIFQKFGFCANNVKGTCPKVHDKKQVTLCKRFLQGKCFSEDCKLSHDVGPEKMPTCRFFLEGCCTRESCPYLHVKVSDKTSICHQFLRGYCEKGNECKQRHVYACPEFDKTGECSKGKYCLYPHVSRSSKPTNLRKTGTVARKMQPPESQVTETCKRYYDDNQGKDLVKVRDKILKEISTVKEIHSGEACSRKNVEVEDFVEVARPRRAPLGPLPAFIPIN